MLRAARAMFYRDYHAGIGRYIQSDPIGLAGGMNLYGYVGGNPGRSIDPEGRNAVAGLWPWCMANPLACGIIVGGSIIVPQMLGADLKSSLDTGVCYDDKVDCSLAKSHHLKLAGINDAHEFKKDILGRKVKTALYDICACKDGSIKIAKHNMCGKPGSKIDTWARWR